MQARILALAGPELDAARAQRLDARRAGIVSTSPLKFAPRAIEVGKVDRRPADRAPSRSGRPAPCRHKRGSRCRPASRSRRRSGRRGAGSPESSTSAASCPARPRSPPAALGVARPEGEIGHLVVEEEAVDHPARAEDRFDRGRHRDDIALRVADDEMAWCRPARASHRRAARRRAGRRARRRRRTGPRADQPGAARRHRRDRAGPRPARRRRPDRRHIGRGRRTSAGSPRRTGTRPADRPGPRAAMSVRSRIAISCSTATPLDGGGGTQIRIDAIGAAERLALDRPVAGEVGRASSSRQRPCADARDDPRRGRRRDRARPGPRRRGGGGNRHKPGCAARRRPRAGCRRPSAK